MFRSSVFRTLEIHRKCATTSGVFIPEKQPNLSRTSVPGATSAGPSPMPLHPTLWQL